jgi:ABC-2 type transport system ATP-binding protein
MSPPAAASSDFAFRLEAVGQAFPVGLGLRRTEVLRGIELELRRGASLGMVGPNGSGKSTLLRLIAGVDRPRTGRVEVLGGSPREPRVRARVGWLPEESPFPRELGARRALELIGNLNGLPRAQARERAGVLLERVGLAHAARTPLGRFSRGMLRRFGLAQAVLADPELLLLDEPTAGLDAPGCEVLEELLAEARARGASVVIASHLLADVHRHCERLAVLIGGRLAAVGTPLELLARAQPDEVAAEVEVSGLDAAALGELASHVRSHGGRWLGARPAQHSLLALYKRLGNGP